MVESLEGFGLTSGLAKPGAALEQSSNRLPEIGSVAAKILRQPHSISGPSAVSTGPDFPIFRKKIKINVEGVN
jgi:hypothetical protein